MLLHILVLEFNKTLKLFLKPLKTKSDSRDICRTGCFCNSGACQQYLGLTDQDLMAMYEAGHVCGDMVDLINGKPTGSVRISFGYMSSQADVDTLLQLIREGFKIEERPGDICYDYRHGQNFLKNEDIFDAQS